MRSKFGSASRLNSDHLFVLNGVVVKHENASFNLSIVEVNKISIGVDIWLRILGHFSKVIVKPLTGSIVEGLDIAENAQKLTPLCVSKLKNHNPWPVGAL